MEHMVQCCFRRYEKKYFVTPAQQRTLLDGISAHMRKDDYGQYTICSIYYDTDDWRLIRASLEKPEYKEKLRVRSYGVPDDDGRVFVELKKKYKGVVYKRRITVKAWETEALLNGKMETAEQIGREIQWFQRFYGAKPKVFIAYDRLAFAGIEEPELRLTMDSNIRWRTYELDLRKGDWGERLIPDDRILMEIKFPGACPLWLSRLLSDAGVFPTSFSKYGTCYREHILPETAEKRKEYYKEAFLSA